MPMPVKTSTSAGMTSSASAVSVISRRPTCLPSSSGCVRHEAGDEDREDREEQGAVEAGADAAGRDLAEEHREEHAAATERAVALVHRVDGAGRRAGRARGEEGEGQMPKRTSLPRGHRADRSRRSPRPT